jgi:hypothetical protein
VLSSECIRKFGVWECLEDSVFVYNDDRYIAFFAGSILAVLVILTVVDEDVLQVERIITIMTVLGIVVTVSRSCIPDEVTVQT